MIEMTDPPSVFPSTTSEILSQCLVECRDCSLCWLKFSFTGLKMDAPQATQNDFSLGGPIKSPSRWLHPFALPLIVFIVLILIVIFLIIFASGKNVGVKIFATVVALAFVAYCTFLGILYILGTPWARDEGANASRPRQSDDMRIDVLPVALGEIGMSQCPGRKRKGVDRDVEQDVRYICATKGFHCVVTTVQARELAVMEAATLGTLVEKHGKKWEWMPIRDKWLPPDDLRFLELVARLVVAVRRGQRVLVHCNGGKGRTGLVVVAMLLVLDPNQSLVGALAAVRAVRPGVLRNPLQRYYLRYLRGSLRRMALFPEHARCSRMFPDGDPTPTVGRPSLDGHGGGSATGREIYRHGMIGSRRSTRASGVHN